jgi:hypothetical protein
MMKDRLGKAIFEGQYVVLTEAPANLLGGLPIDDQQAIISVVGKPVLLVGIDAHDNAELEFTDARGVIHTIWVACACIEAAVS